eukprot:COSAG01_NODE_10312_length_2194_cov_163.059666_2_plen_387_part_00
MAGLTDILEELVEDPHFMGRPFGIWPADALENLLARTEAVQAQQMRDGDLPPAGVSRGCFAAESAVELRRQAMMNFGDGVDDILERLADAAAGYQGDELATHAVKVLRFVLLRMGRGLAGGWHEYSAMPRGVEREILAQLPASVPDIVLNGAGERWSQEEQRERAVAAMPDATLRVRRSRGPDGTQGFRVQRTPKEGADVATSDSEEEFFDCAPALPPADAATRTAIRALRARLVPAVVLSGTTTPEQLNSARQQLSAGIEAATAAKEAQREAGAAAVETAVATAVAAEELQLEPEPELEPASELEAELEPELERAMDPAAVLALMVKAMAAPASSSPVMDEPTEPTEPLERPRRRARARLFVLLEGGVQPDDAKVFDRGKRHTHT